MSSLDELVALGGGGALEAMEAPAWIDDDSILYADGSGGLDVVRASDGERRRICADLGGMPFLGSHELQVSPDRRWLAYLSNAADETGEGLEVELWLLRLDDDEPGTPQRLTHLAASINSFRWSPASDVIAFAGSQRGTYDVYLAEVPSGATRRVTGHANYEVYPTFAGSRLLFVRLDETWARHEIWSVALDGTDATLLAQDDDFFDYHYGRTFSSPLVRPDSQQLVFRSHRSGWINYWALGLDGERPSAPRRLAPADADQSAGCWSPDGRQLAYIENHNGTQQLRVVEPASGEVRVLAGENGGACALPCWSPDGTRLAYLYQSLTTAPDLFVVDLAGGEPRRLTHTPVPDDLIEPRKVQYASFDGRLINAYLYLPSGASPADHCPGLMWIHGGPTSQFNDTLQPAVQYFAQRGYAVLLPNIRGSSGYGKEFEDLNNGDWGHGDLQDVLAGVGYLGSTGVVDTDRMGIHGTSYGGCMSMSAAAWAPGVFRASVPHAGYGDWLAMQREQELRHLQLLRYELGPFDTAEHVYRRCSPFFDIARVQTPMLVIQGEGKLPRSDASHQWCAEMRRFYKPVRHRVYPNEAYYVRSHAGRRSMLEEMERFLDEHLKGAAVPGPAAG
jgi:dipeptidyl aminopeptidase/acylaminoacyl peptidase